jgi:phosphoribosyl-AMP cyclohydrolase
MSDGAIGKLKFNDAGLIPAIVQDADNGEVLMMAWMNAESLRRTLQTGRTHFWSRSRGKAWMKGESSGHVQQVVSVSTDCDKDTLLVRARQTGGACHTGYRSCFSWHLEAGDEWTERGQTVFDPKDVYGG